MASRSSQELVSAVLENWRAPRVDPLSTFPLLGAPGEPDSGPGGAEHDPADPNDMTLSPKPTPFSVSDILYPYEEVYRKSAALEPGLVPPVYRTSQQNMANPYAHMHVPQLSAPAAAFPAQYCNTGDFGHYGDVRNTSAGWYSTPTDPRFASEYRAGRVGACGRRVARGGRQRPCVEMGGDRYCLRSKGRLKGYTERVQDEYRGVHRSRVRRGLL